jgi:hypothetical protein
MPMHTLAPWTIGSSHGDDPDAPEYKDDTAGWPYFVREPQGAEHPHGLGYGGLHVACGVQRLEDARLIAAAPDMLDLLGRLLAWEKFMGGYGSPAWDQARELHGKLTGNPVEPESDEGHPPPCTNPAGHSWVTSEETDRSYCEFCSADGDA